jgi:hypothetical protein
MLSDNIHQAAHYLSRMPPNRTLRPNRRVAAIGSAPVTNGQAAKWHFICIKYYRHWEAKCHRSPNGVEP